MNIHDPYKILGISPDSSENEIKKAYKELARKTHPDKGGTEEDFKLINEAYTQIMRGDDPSISFPELNELFTMFKNIGFNFQNINSVIKGPTIKTNLKLTLEEIQTGGKFLVKYSRIVPTGKYTNSLSTTPFGVLNVISPEETIKNYEVYVNIPRCYDNIKPLIFENLAKADNLPSGDLEVYIIPIKHDIFTRIPGTLDLQIELSISLKESLIGFDKEIKLLGSEEIIKIECRSIVNPYDIKRIKNYGMQLDNDICGDMLIKFKIIFPIILSNDVINIIKQIDI